MGLGLCPRRNVQVVQMVQQTVSKAQEVAARAYSGGKQQLLPSGNRYAFPWNEGNKQEQGRLKLFSVSTSSWSLCVLVW